MNRQANVFKRAVNSVLEIVTTDGNGSGFLARDDGLILTAAHVVGSERVVRARDLDGNMYSCRVVKTDRHEDVAALVFAPGSSRLKTKPLRICSCPSSGLDVGRQAIAIGNPAKCSPFTFSNGRISAPVNGRKNGRHPRLQLNMSVNWGNSGGPIILLDGDVCGMAVGIEFVEFPEKARVEGVSYAVSSDCLKDFMSSIPKLQDRLDRMACCTVCGENVPSKKYCANCGYELPSIEKEEEMVAKFHGCSVCGAEISENEKYCSDCGSPLN